MIIRCSLKEDLTAIHAIYADEVVHGLATFEEQVPCLNDLALQRQNCLDLGLPHLVAELDGKVAGFAYAARYRNRPAYRFTVEDSVYISPSAQGYGIGKALLGAVIKACERGGWRQMIAIISDAGNDASVRLHESCGFRRIGTLSDVGFKKNRWISTFIMQRPLKPAD